MGRVLFVMHLVFLLLSAVLIFGSIGGFFGGGYMITSALLVIALWGVFAGLTINAVRLVFACDDSTYSLPLQWAKWLFFTLIILSPFTGLGFAFLSFVGCGPLYVPDLYHWTGMIATILAFLAFFLLPVFVRWCLDDSNEYARCSHWAWMVFAPLGVVLLWGGLWLGWYLKLKGDINVSEYTASNHVYQLPFPGGDSSWVIQGNNSDFNHNNSNFGQKYAWDFRRSCGSPVLASRKGKISSFVDSNDSFGSGATNNQVVVDQGDGTFAFYLHIQKGSVPTKFRTVGTAVSQGDQIADVGCVGNSLTGHIHFMVRPGASASTTIGVSFTDVKDDNGIPRTFSSYTSGNRRVP